MIFINSKQKTNFYLRIIFLGFAIVYILWAGIYTKKQDAEFYRQFNSANICGRISYLGDGGYGAYLLSVKSDTTIYFFNPKVNVNHRFKHTQVGDSILKAAYSDTLWVKNKGEWHPYTFSKYEE